MTERREPDRETDLVCGDSFPKWSEHNQEPGIPSGSPMSKIGTQELGESSVAFPGAFAESWIGHRGASTWNQHSDMGCQHGKPQLNLLHHSTSPSAVILNYYSSIKHGYLSDIEKLLNCKSG